VKTRILAATLFLSAFLLFLCQPLVGKMLLPYLGGAASVWTTCVLFFQFMLLVGYVYAHILTRIADIRKQIAVHAIVLLLPLAFLPFRFNALSSESFSRDPLLLLLAALIASTAIPFFVVSTTAPLLQNWFSRSAHASSSDPYFLYSASNAGSLLALVVYPLAIEPRIGVEAQTWLWSAGYAALLLMLGITVATLYRQLAFSGKKRDSQLVASVLPSPGWKTRLYWIVAAFVPSGLMLAVTNHIAANVGSVPFLWLVPLAVYLLTFIVAFARRFRIGAATASRFTPFVLLGVFPFVAVEVVAQPGLNWILIGAHVLLLFAGGLLCHVRLAESRPEPQHLTDFYFWVAFGGVMGGIFTATIAPAVFKTVFEYPLLVIALPFFRGGKPEKSDFLIPGALAVGMLIAWMVFRTTHLDSDTEAVALAHTVLVFAGYKLRKQPQRFAWAFAVFMLAYAFILPGYIEGANRLFTARNFFGVKKVLDDPALQLRTLRHGDTTHGIESTDPARAGLPLSYYYQGGSVSDVVDIIRLRQRPQRIGVLGLGAGTMASYADATHHVTFYEIDPSIELIARQYFTFLSKCGSNCDVIVGDGRLQLSREADGTFDLLLLDAFSSDSVPTHLLSREALRMYLAKLKPDGLLIFNVSNRYLNVEKLVSALVADEGLVSFSRFDDAGELRKTGKSSANHLAAAHRLEDLRALATRSGWTRVARPADFQPWTDDYSNLLSLIRWH
jgi:SAM-dependent methyltransferase